MDDEHEESVTVDFIGPMRSEGTRLAEGSLERANMEVLMNGKKLSPWIIGIVVLTGLVHFYAPMSRGVSAGMSLIVGCCLIYYGLRFGNKYWKLGLPILGLVVIAYGSNLLLGAL